MEYKCLRCLRTWPARIDDPERCPWCGSYHILDYRTFQELVDETERLIVNGLPARFPRIDALRAVFRKFGLLQLLKADETLNLVEAILEELLKRHGPYWFIKHQITF